MELKELRIYFMEIQATKNYYNAFNSFRKSYQSSEKTHVWSSGFFELILFTFPQEIKIYREEKLIHNKCKEMI